MRVAGKALDVVFDWGDEVAQPVGRLAMRDHRALFEFAPSFIASGLQISPLRLSAKPGVHSGEQRLEGLPGVFHDSLPDAWGRLLVDRRALSLGIRPAALTALDRLACVGDRGVGALCYRPAVEVEVDAAWLDLDALEREARQLVVGQAVDVLDTLFVAGGSPGGARPKLLVAWDPSTGEVQHGADVVPPGFAPLLVKFAAPTDPEDIGLIELAYSQMAAAAGVEMMPCRLLPSKTGPGYFATERFDRPRIHVHTLSGLLHTDHTVPNLDYDHLLRVTTSLTRDRRQVARALRLMVFNVLAHNRDDHGKQFSFLMSREGVWRLAPAYDLTCADGPGGQHTMTVGGEGRRPTRAHLLELARRAGVEAPQQIIDDVAAAIARWPEFARTCGVGARSTAWVSERLAPG